MTRNASQFMMIASLLLFTTLGCTDQSPLMNSAPKSPKFVDGLSADEIYSRMIATYAAADTYQDKAVLYLSYTMDGQNIQEEQPWRFSWKKGDRFAADWYNAEIRSDGNRLGCFVFDLETGNLDNQWLLIRKDPDGGLKQLLSDSIAKHFATGASELPIRLDSNSTGNLLIPPTVGWLTGQLPWPALSNERSKRREADAKVDGVACYHIQVGDESSSYDLWIDQKSLVLRQMTLPTTFLDPLVTSSKEVAEIQFFARMHEPIIGTPLADESFSVIPPRDATAVQQFVAIPEAFPCETIGQKISDMRLFDEEGKEFKLESLDGNTNLFVWFSGLSGPGIISRLNELQVVLRRLASARRPNVYFVYSDEHLDPSSPEIPIAHRWLVQSAKNLQIDSKWLFDHQLDASEKIRLIRLPAIVVIGPDRTVEYARCIDEQNWADSLLAAIDRTTNGERISIEMKNDYEQFVERYKQKLQLVSAATLPGFDAFPLNEGNSVGEIRFSEAWRNTDLKRAGNIYSIEDNKFLVFDGWRTICEFDDSGNILRRIELDLPPGEAVTCLRQSERNGGKKIFALFSVLGHSIFLYDENWKLVQRIIAPNNDNLFDCAFATWQSQLTLFVAFKNQGLEAFDSSGQTLAKISEKCFESLSTDGKKLFGLSDGLAFEIEVEQTHPIASPITCRYQLVRLHPQLSMGRLICSGVDSNSSWHLLAYDFVSQEWRNSPVGAQVFESEIEPLAICANSTRARFAAADTFGAIKIFDENGKLVAGLKCVGGLTGLALIHSGDGDLIVTSNSKEVQATRGK